MKAKKLLVVIAGAAVLPFMGNAASLTYSAPYATVPPSGTSVVLPLYDGSLGPLLKVTLGIDGSIVGLFTALNTASVPNTITLQWDPVTSAADVTLASSPWLSVNGAASFATAVVLPPGGATDFGGPIGLGYSDSDSTTAAGAMAEFTGAGTFGVDISNVVPWTITGVASATGDALAFSNAGEVWVRYEVPEPQTYALLAGLGMLGFVAVRRRFRA